jgi:hypothetical protein
MSIKSKKWPRITAVSQNGKAAFQLECRIKGRGERKYFATRTEAEGQQQLLRIERNNEGISSMGCPKELREEALKCQRRVDPVKASLTDAVEFLLEELKATRGTQHGRRTD